MKKNQRSILALLALAFLFGSCAKKLDLAPVSTISDANYWKTADQFSAFVAGLHIAFRNCTRSFEFLGEIRADNFGTDPGNNSAFTGESVADYEYMWNNNLSADKAGVPNFGGFYTNINQINLLISKLNSTDIVTPEDQQYYLGVAYGMRAFYYFQLLRSWGDVIIQTEPTVSIDVSNLAKAASPSDSVMALIKADIALSETSFGDDYTFRENKSYWSKAATLMLKANVYLWTSYRGGGTGDATIALNALNDIQQHISSLRLMDNYMDVFSTPHKDNDEIIFAIHNQLNESSQPFASVFYPQTNFIINYYDSVSQQKFNVANSNWAGLLQVPVKIATFRTFNDKDTRKWAAITAAYNLQDSHYQIAGCFLTKYKGQQDAGKTVYTDDYPIYRYAGLLLLKAEAESILGMDASQEINMVRARAYGADYHENVDGYPHQPVDKSWQEAILQERRFELMGEGKRWYDLRRMGDDFVYKHTNIQPSDAYKLLWPIDRNTLTNNSALQQTPGYPLF